jgi:hypothetical protein
VRATGAIRGIDYLRTGTSHVLPGLVSAPAHLARVRTGRPSRKIPRRAMLEETDPDGRWAQDQVVTRACLTKRGWVMLAELAEDEEATQAERVAGLVVGLVPPGVEVEGAHASSYARRRSLMKQTTTSSIAFTAWLKRDVLPSNASAFSWC